MIPGLRLARSDARAVCTNDHMFICPRDLCRAYFTLLELWESDHCVPMPPPGSEAQPAPPLIYATSPVANTALVMNAAPSQNFSVPAPPDRSGPLSFPEWYILARYTTPPARCSIAEPDGGAACCGLMAVFAYPYAMARGDSSAGFVSCSSSLDRTWPTNYSLRTNDANRDAYRACRQLSSGYFNRSDAYDCAVRQRDTEGAIRRGNAEQQPMKMASLRREECRFLRSYPNFTAGDAVGDCDVC